MQLALDRVEGIEYIDDMFIVQRWYEDGWCTVSPSEDKDAPNGSYKTTGQFVVAKNARASLVRIAIKFPGIMKYRVIRVGRYRATYVVNAKSVEAWKFHLGSI